MKPTQEIKRKKKKEKVRDNVQTRRKKKEEKQKKKKNKEEAMHRVYRPDQKKKKKKSNELDKLMSKCTWAFSSFIYQIPPTQFSLHFGENILVGLGRKHSSPTNFFLSPPSNQTPTKKVLFPIFSPKFFIHPISPLNKHTLTTPR